MRQIVPSSIIAILRIRIYIARQSEIFRLNDIAKGWEMSRPTLYRYDSSEYRELSRHHARLQNQPKTHINCYRCDKPIHSHKRCKRCTILLHDDPCDCTKTRSIDTKPTPTMHGIQTKQHSYESQASRPVLNAS